MRVLHLTNCYPYDDDPSYGIFVYEQVETLRTLGVDCGVEFINGKRSKGEYFSALGRALSQRLGRDHDLVHAHHAYAGLIACTQRRRPTVVSFLGSELDEVPRLCQWVARRADRVIVMAPWMEERLAGVDVEVIPDGIDLELFRPMDRAACREHLGLAPDDHVVLFPWNPSRPEKRYGLALAAVKFASERLGRKVRILTLSRRPHAEVVQHMNAADALVLTSTAEGSCNSVKEALACNLPVVGVDVGDTRQLVGDERCGHVGPANAEWLGSQLARVLREARRAPGRERIADLELGRVTERVLGVYAELVGADVNPTQRASRARAS